MSDQRCSTCRRCTPEPEHDGLGVCEMIGAVVVVGQTGGRCRLYQSIGGPERIRVRIVVAVMADGQWAATGEATLDDRATREEMGNYCEYCKYDSYDVHWIEADIPLPASETIEGVVT